MSVHFKIITPVYNSESYIRNTLISVLGQDYDNFEYIITDDCSTDNTVNVIKEFIEEYDCGDYFTLIENDENMGALYNLYHMIQNLDAFDDDVIVTLDGDDWLASEYVLSILDHVYEHEDCWMTYGSYVQHPSGRDSSFHVTEYPKNIVEDGTFRDDPAWRASHLRTFNYNLAKRLTEDDMVDDDGTFYEMAWDFALMFPMMEMARERVRFIKDTLYVYNDDNPINDHKKDRQRQIDIGDRIRKKNNRRERLV